MESYRFTVFIENNILGFYPNHIDNNFYNLIMNECINPYVKLCLSKISFEYVYQSKNNIKKRDFIIKYNNRIYKIYIDYSKCCFSRQDSYKYIEKLLHDKSSNNTFYEL